MFKPTGPIADSACAGWREMDSTLYREKHSNLLGGECIMKSPILGFTGFLAVILGAYCAYFAYDVEIGVYIPPDQADLLFKGTGLAGADRVANLSAMHLQAIYVSAAIGSFIVAAIFLSAAAIIGQLEGAAPVEEA